MVWDAFQAVFTEVLGVELVEDGVSPPGGGVHAGTGPAGRARLWERAVVEMQRARRRVRKDGMGLRLLGKCYRIFFVWWRLCFAGVFVKNCGLGVIFCVVRMVWWW